MNTAALHSQALTQDASAAEQARQQRQSDVRTISLIGLAHGTSHFFHMLLPPLFPAFIRDFGLSYSQLGLLVTTFFVISGLGQALAGFLVDKRGAPRSVHGPFHSGVAPKLADRYRQ